VDFADVRTVMKEMGDALMGSGVASGEHRAVEAANNAISSPLLEGVSIAGAQGVLLNVTGGKNMTLVEIEEAANIIYEASGDEANIILGAVIDENMTDEMMVTVIATGFNKRGVAAARQAKATKIIDRIPSGVHELQKLDEPAYLRRGIGIVPDTQLRPETGGQEKIDKADPEKPAFLRKIMD
jgi:cell division protein FtsZ